MHLLSLKMGGNTNGAMYDQLVIKGANQQFWKVELVEILESYPSKTE